MKKRIFCLFLVLALCLGTVPATVLAADPMTKVSVTDTAVNENHMVYDVNGIGGNFYYNVPEGGATMLVFFSASCGRSQTLFTQLNKCSWIQNPNVNIIAIETRHRSTQSLAEFVDTYAPDTWDHIQYYYANEAMLWSYWFLVSDQGSTSWPVVYLISEDGTIEYADMAMAIPDRIQESLRQMSPAFDAHMNQIPETSFGTDVAITGALFYDTTSQILDLVNKERAAVGLPALILDEKLTYCAMLRAVECSLYYSHTRPTGEAYSSVLADSIPTGSSAENIAYGQRSPEAVMTAWMNSDGHRKNILRANMTHLGVGAAYVNGRFFWVQLFHDAATATENYERTNNSVFLATVSTVKEYLKPLHTQTKLEFVLEAGNTTSRRISLLYTCYDGEVSCPLLPTLIDLDNPQAEVPLQDDSGNTVATICAAMDGSGDLIVTAISPGTVTAQLPVYEGEENPITLNIAVKAAAPSSGVNVLRVYGDNRFQTAFEVADQLKENQGISKFNTVIVASGADFADALSGSYLAAVTHAPILLGYTKGDYNRQIGRAHV